MPKVLIVTDKGPQPEIEAALEESGFDVERAPCVISALESVLVQIPDLIFLMDQIQGLDAADLLELKCDEAQLEPVPVVVCSRERDRRVELYEMGADDFIAYPADDKEIVARVNSVIRRTAPKEGISGDFNHVQLTDIVQLLTAAQSTGKLEIHCQNGGGVLYFKDGQVIQGLTPTLEGEDAFGELLRLSLMGGQFLFVREAMDSVKKVIKKRTDHLLLGFASSLDEEGIVDEEDEEEEEEDLVPKEVEEEEEEEDEAEEDVDWGFEDE